MTNRLFIAAEIPSSSFEKIFEIRNEIFKNNNSVRWEPLNKLHLTLKFLGDTPAELIDSIENSLDEIARKSEPIRAFFTEIGLFYKNKKPAILWLGLKESENLTNLAENIDNACVKLGFQKEKRKFTPHITLARLKGKENFSLINNFVNQKLPVEKFAITKINLFKSELRPSGSVYTILKSFNLKTEE